MEQLSSILCEISDHIDMCDEEDVEEALYLAERLQKIVTTWKVNPDKVKDNMIDKQLKCKLFPFYWMAKNSILNDD